MKPSLVRIVGLAILIAASAAVLAARAPQKADFRAAFSVDKAKLSSTGRGAYFILEPGYRLYMQSGKDTLIITVLEETKVVDGVTTRIVEERETEGGQLVEVSRNYFAIDNATGDVYYFGEDVDMYKNGKVTGHEGAWLSGVNGAKFGLMVPGAPKPGDRYYQESAPKVAMDRAEVVAINAESHGPRGRVQELPAHEGVQRPRERLGGQVLRSRRRPHQGRRFRAGQDREGEAVVRVLVVEDNPPIQKAVAKGLREAGFAVDVTGDGEEGLWYATSNDYDVVVLDLMLPRVDGLTILNRLRSEGRSTHVLIVTARDTVQDRVLGLDLGADDYLVKPFAFEELLARVRALARRAYSAKNPLLSVDDLRLETSTRRVWRGDDEVVLTSREYALLEYLAMRAGEAVSRTDIWEHVYEFKSEADSNVVDVYIGYLRKKVERPDRPPLIHTIRGVGYSLRGTR